MYPESQDKWKRQTNLYKMMLEHNGYPVERIVIVPFFRDWSEVHLFKNRDYPKSQIIEIDIPLHPYDKILNYAAKRIELHLEAERSGVLPLCTGKERWAKADTWVVKTPGSKKALRRSDVESLVDEYISANKHRYPNMYKEKTPGTSSRCDKFCPVNIFCDQYKREQELRLEIANEK
jgi:hypothetical protein